MYLRNFIVIEQSTLNLMWNTQIMLTIRSHIGQPSETHICVFITNANSDQRLMNINYD